MSTQEAGAVPVLPTDVCPRDSSLDLDYWANRWTNNFTGWHQAEGNKPMWEYMNKHYLPSITGKDSKDIKVLVPLCGKAVDMILLHKQGFTVVGVEYATAAVEEFFTENSIPIQSNPPINSKSDQTYTVSGDGRIVIGHGDVFKFTPDNLPFPTYDLIWDRGAFEALNKNDRGRYSSLMTSLLAEDGLYLINSKDYDTTEYGGPPLAANREDLLSYYGERHSVEEVGNLDMLNPDDPFSKKWIDRGIKSYMRELTHVITKKSL